MDVAEIRRQDRQAALGILAGAIPPPEGFRRESMPEVVKARAVTVGVAAQTDLSGQRIKRAMNVADIQAIPPARHEQIGRHAPALPMTVPSSEVLGERLAG
jgi:hypothetical protein